ncbi:MAG: YcbK family protein [Thermochromatium sp.]
MNRRYFLGVALSVAAAPVAAAPFFLRRTPERPRVLSFHHLHTDEWIDVTYRIGDTYQHSALQRLNHFFRDFRTDEVTNMDPHLFDLLYDLKLQLGDPDARFDVISAYRSPTTNAQLRKVSCGVARNSLHLRGQAVDVRFPDLSTRLLRDAAVALGRGGVGYYKRSDFVHLDTGEVRSWGA